MYQPTPSARNPMTVDQLNRLYKRSPSPPPRITLPQIKLLPPVGAFVGAAALVLLTPKPTANEDAILRKLKKQEIDRKVTLDPFELPPSEPPFIGGQGIGIKYLIQVYGDITSEISGNFFPNQPLGESQVWGPIDGFYIEPDPGGSSDIIFAIARGYAYQSFSPVPIARAVARGGGGNTRQKLTNIRYVITRLDGLPDTDGNLKNPNLIPKPNTIADPNRIKRERGDRPAPAAVPKYIDTRPRAPGAGWLPPPGFSWTKPGFKKDPNFNPNNEPFKLEGDPEPVSEPSDLPLPLKVYSPPQTQVSPSSPPTPKPTPQERPFPPQSVADGISPQSTPQILPPPSPKTDTAPITIPPTSPKAVLPPAPAPTPTPNRTPTAIPAPNPTYDPGKGGLITYSSPPQNFVPNPVTLAPTPLAPPQIRPPVDPTPPKTPIEEIGQKLKDLAIPVGTIAVGITQILKRTTPEALENAAAAGTCRTTQPGGCTTAAINRGNQDLLNKLGVPAGQVADLLLLTKIDDKLGNKITGGLSGGLGRMSNFLGIDRALSILTFLSTVHNASMLTSSLKVTLLETLSSVGNATGLLQTSEGDNVDLNKTFNQGIEGFIVGLIGAESWASMKLTWRKYSPIYRAGSNVLSNVGNMFSSIGNGIEVIGERTGKIGNALRAASVVRENAYNYMSENMTVHTNKFMTFQQSVEGVTEVLEAINEVAESTIEGQQSYTEAVKATTEFKKVLAETDKNSEKKDAENAAIKKEAETIKANLVKDPTGEDETGLLSFLTDL